MTPPDAISEPFVNALNSDGRLSMDDKGQPGGWIVVGAAVVGSSFSNSKYSMSAPL